MATLTFEKLKEKLGIGLEVMICEKMLPENFFKDLELNDWLEIYQESKSGSNLEQKACDVIKSSLRFTAEAPLVGTFTVTGNWPDASEKSPLVKVGDRVEPDTVICGIEAMMVQNEIKAGVCGIVTKVLVEHGDPVDYKQVLFEIKPDL